MRIRIAFVALVIAAAALVGWRVLGPGGISPHRPRLTIAPAGSDYFMRAATIYQMNKQGRLEYRMRLDEAIHHPDGSANLRNIHVHYKTGATTYWTLQAAYGQVPPHSQDIHLTGGVTLHHPQPDGPTVVIQTTDAWVRSQRNVIETQAHVTAREPGRKIQADGLHINLDNDQTKLLHNVQTYYEP